MLYKLDIESVPNLLFYETNTNNLVTRKEELVSEKDFFSSFTEGRTSANDRYKIEIEEKDGYFNLSERRHTPLKSFSRNFLGKSESETKQQNLIEARYFDPYSYSIEEPALVIIVLGGRSFSEGSEEIYDRVTRGRIKEALEHSYISDYPSYHIYIRDTQKTIYHFQPNFHETHVAFLKNLLIPFQERNSPLPNESNPQVIFDIFDACLAYINSIEHVLNQKKEHMISKAIKEIDNLSKLKGVLSQDSVYGKIAREYIKSQMSR